MKISTSRPSIVPGAVCADTTWRVDPGQSAASFEASTLWGRVPVRGVLGPVSGELHLHEATGHGRLAIATTGLSSGIGLRDHHLRSGVFFDIRRHPEITFFASEVAIEPRGAHLSGELTVRGTPKPFSCAATPTAVAEDRLVLETTTAFDLDELGMSRGLLRMIPASVRANVRVLLYRLD